MARIGGWLVLVAVLAGLTSPAQAQRGRVMEAQGPPVQPAGTIDAIGGGMIRVKTGDAVQPIWLLQVAREAKIKVTGKGNADSLMPGLCVSFSAEVDKNRGTVTEKVSKLTIFTLTPQRMLGVLPGGLGGGNPGMPQPGDFGAPSKRDTGPATGRFEIAGKITGGKKGKLSVFVGPNQHLKSPQLNVDLADEVEVTIDLEGPGALSMVTVGSKIEAKGKQFGQMPQASVNDVKIELAEATAEDTTGASAKKPLRTKPTRTNTRTKRGEDQPDAAAADGEEENPDAKHATKRPVRRPKKGDKPDADDEKPEAGDAKSGDKADPPAEGKDKP